VAQQDFETHPDQDKLPEMYAIAPDAPFVCYSEQLLGESRRPQGLSTKKPGYSS